MKNTFNEQTYKIFKKKLISANECIVGETYYLTGDWVDYGDLFTVGIANALAIASGEKIKSIKYKTAKCLINTPVKFLGKASTARMILRKGFKFETNKGEEIRMFANNMIFREKFNHKT